MLIKTTYDVVVIGGGPSGSSTAYFLAKNGLSVLVIDKSLFPRDKACGDALSPGAIEVLDKMDILPQVEAEGYCVNQVKVYAPNGNSVSAKINQEDKKLCSIWIISRYSLDNLVHNHIINNNIDFLDNTRVNGLTNEKTKTVINCTRKKVDYSINARIVVVATGANFGLLSRLGLLSKRPSIGIAARAYFDEINEFDTSVHTYLISSPFTGYGWIFPSSETGANVGIGCWHNQVLAKKESIRTALKNFTRSERITQVLSNAKQIGKVKSYPIRYDFTSSITFSNNCIFVGEAAGLVNPLTGEGVGYALESGKLAAEYIGRMFQANNFSKQMFAAYDSALRAKYQKEFTNLLLIREIYMKPFLVNQAVRSAQYNEKIRDLFLKIALGYPGAAKALSPITLLKVLIGQGKF